MSIQINPPHLVQPFAPINAGRALCEGAGRLRTAVLNHTFKRELGMTPGAYRKKVTAD